MDVVKEVHFLVLFHFGLLFFFFFLSFLFLEVLILEKGEKSGADSSTVAQMKHNMFNLSELLLLQIH